MKTKLTLNIEESIVDKVKALSRKQKQSVSSIVENYLKLITASRKRKSAKQSLTFTEQFRAKFPNGKFVPSDIDYKKEWHKHLDEKYGG